MNPEEMQQNMSPEMSPDDAMAALAISTRMSEQMMAPQGETMPQEGELGAEMAPGGTETPDTANITDEITNGLKEAKTELKGELRDMIKTELKKLMDDDDEEEVTNEQNNE